MTQTNCPNCGAPIVGHKCAYCGTVFDPERVNKKPIDHRQQYLNKMYIMGRVTREQYIALCEAHANGLDECTELRIQSELLYSDAIVAIEKYGRLLDQGIVSLNDIRGVEFDPKTEEWELYI